MSVKESNGADTPTPEQLAIDAEAKAAADKLAADDADAKQVQAKADAIVASTSPTKKEKPAPGKIDAPEKGAPESDEGITKRIGGKMAIGGMIVAAIGILLRNL